MKMTLRLEAGGEAFSIVKKGATQHDPRTFWGWRFRVLFNAMQMSWRLMRSTEQHIEIEQ